MRLEHPAGRIARIALPYQQLAISSMPLYALGINHSTAPLIVREQVAFHIDTLG